MDRKLIITIMTCICTVHGAVYGRYGGFDYDPAHPDDYYDIDDKFDKELPDPFNDRETPNPEPKRPTYKVTEEVDDIPNPALVQPIITNFTVPRPINLARPNTRPRQVQDSENQIFEGLESFDYEPDEGDVTHEDFLDGKDILNGIKKIGNHLFQSVKGTEIINVPVDFLRKAHDAVAGFNKKITDFLSTDD